MDPDKIVLLIFILIILIVGNLIFLDIRSFKSASNSINTVGLTEVPATLPDTTPPATSSAGSSVGCGADCQSYINVKIANLKTELNNYLSHQGSTPLTISPPSSSPTPTPTPSSSQGQASNAPTVYTVAFGVSGSTQATSYTDVAGSELTFNTANYPGAKEFLFDADLRADAPDRTTYARLYDVTHGVGVQGSDISAGGLNAVFSESSPLSFQSGNLNLRLQIHSLNGNFAYIDGARIKIIY